MPCFLLISGCGVRSSEYPPSFPSKIKVLEGFGVLAIPGQIPLRTCLYPTKGATQGATSKHTRAPWAGSQVHVKIGGPSPGLPPTLFPVHPKSARTSPKIKRESGAPMSRKITPKPFRAPAAFPTGNRSNRPKQRGTRIAPKGAASYGRAPSRGPVRWSPSRFHPQLRSA